MSNFLFNFETDVKDGIPATVHTLVVEDAKVKKTTTGKQMIALKLKIEEEKETNSTDNKGLTVYENIVLEHTNPRGKSIVASKCKILSQYAGVSPADESGNVTLDGIKNMVAELVGTYVDAKLRKDNASDFMVIGKFIEPDEEAKKEEAVVI